MKSEFQSRKWRKDMNFQHSGNVIVKNNEVYINGEKMPSCPTEGNNMSIVDNKVFIDGYELINGKWKRTLKALWHKWF